ncbi:MAG TPA: TonB-dependent receptor [Gemmatimonadaceae bacterium]|nr:TonB-dependent receptor [Gemmatimonadaceae bacterium]
MYIYKLISCSVAALAAAPLAAQQPDTARIAPVVVTATRTPIDAASSPATVAVITGAELRLRGITSVADALETIPGVTLARNGSFGATTSLFLRGGESKYVKVLVDGVPVNDPGGNIDLSTLTTDNVDRIEIVRGPASVLYGADAVTGVVQIFTRRGRGPTHTVLSARGGSYGSADEDGTILGALGGGDFSLSLARHDTRGIYRVNSADHNTVFSGGANVAIDPRTNLRVSLRYTDGLFRYPTDGAGDVVDTNAHQTQDRTVLSAELSRFFTARVDGRLLLTSEETTGGTDDPPDDSTAAGFESLDHVRRRGADARTDIALSSSTLTLGAQLEQEDQRTESQSVFGSYNSTSIFHAARRNRALYAQLLATLSDSVVVTAGARLDDNEAFGKFGTYRVGASWAPIGGTRIRSSIATAFREPTFFENFATGYVTGNPNLTPERARTWEIGATQALLDGRLTLGITQFDQQFRNMIDYTGSTDACGASYCNVARARSNGREFEIHLAASRHISLDANLTHLETKVLTPGFDTTSGGLYHENEQLIRRPTTSWNLGGAFASRRGSFDLRVMHVGARPDRDFRPYPAIAVTDPAYTRTDLGADLPLAAFSPELRDAALTLRVENLFDVNYQSVFNFLSPRRTVLAGARVSF